MMLYPVVQNGEYGFIRDDGSIAISPQYEAAMMFSEGFAGIKQNGKWGFINTDGDLVVPPRFDNCQSFASGLALVEDGDSKQYIDPIGNVVIRANFYECGSFEEDIALVRPDTRTSGVFIDRTGRIVLSGRDFLVSEFSNGLINCSEGGKWGFINRAGDFVIHPQYLYACPFREGLAAVAPNDEDKFCFIDPTGQVAIAGEFGGASIKFSGGLCAVWNKYNGYIDRTGRLVIPYRFYCAGHFSEGLAVIQEPDSKFYGYVNEAGKIAIKQTFRTASAFNGKLAHVGVGEKKWPYQYGYIDRKGKYVWKPSQ